MFQVFFVTTHPHSSFLHFSLFIIPAPLPSFPRRRESSLLNGRLRHLVIRCPFGTFFSLDSRLRGNDEGSAGRGETQMTNEEKCRNNEWG